MKRPSSQDKYSKNFILPPKPFQVSWDWVPETVRASLEPLCGIQPVTQSMFKVAKQNIFTEPTKGEIEMFKKYDTQFQMINVVLSLAWWEETDDNISAIPYAVSIKPASKRGQVTTQSIEAIAALKGAPVNKSTEEVYTDFDPFNKTSGMYIIGGDYLKYASAKTYIDTCGIVIERYFLNTSYDFEDVLEVDSFLPNKKSCESYLRNRLKTVYKPFDNVSIRRIWGIETQPELLLFQELLFHGQKPDFQHLIYPDGTTYPSLYDVYSDIEFRHGQDLVTEVDFYFPEQKLAIFCDGAHHRRKKNIERDKRVDAKLKEQGITSIRIPNELIRYDLAEAVKPVLTNLQ